jgi:RNA polymerase sigma factor (sigma-70 family)
MQTQRELVEQAVGGDHAAFSELARRAVDRMYAIARLIVRDNVRAEDATQEALVSAWRMIKSLRDPDRFDAWLRRILLNECYREARRERARFRHEAYVVGLPTDNVNDPGDSLGNRDELERVFVRLKPDDRALIVMHFYLGLPLADTADALGLPVGTVKSRLHRTTQHMRAWLEADARITHAIEGRSA